MNNKKITYARHAFAVIAFLSVFFVVDRGLSVVFDRLVMRSEIRFSAMYSGRADADILILGDSRGVNGFYVPDMDARLPEKSFNLSYNGMGMGVCESVFADYLDHNKTPRMLILEVTNLDMRDDLINGLKLYSRHSPRIVGLLRKENRRNATVCEVTHLFRYNDELFLRSLFYLGKNDQNWINRYRIDPAFASSYKPASVGNSYVGSDEKVALPAEGLEHLRNILELANERGIAVRLVVTPFLPAHIRAMDADYRAWLSSLRRAVGPKYRIWDYSDAVGDVFCFADPVHMNEDGSRVLLQKMLQDGFFKEANFN